MHNKSVSHVLVVLTVMLTGLTGCDPQSRGFALPQGNAEAGKAAFLALSCNDCHSIGTAINKSSDGDAEIHFKLGGPTTRVKTYGDLVTSIINPSHKISGWSKAAANVDAQGNSRMRLYNDVMTVQQLIDITTYLETTYEVVRPQHSPMYVP